MVRNNNNKNIIRNNNQKNMVRNNKIQASLSI